jgi:hypothetical protein
MKTSFTMTREEVATSDAAVLKASILAATGDEAGTASILRSLERMGADPSIEYFEMTDVSSTRRHDGTYHAAWRVRADRGVVEEVEP